METQKQAPGNRILVVVIALVGVVNFRPEHRVKRRLSGSGGRPHEETGSDVGLRANFPQSSQ